MNYRITTCITTGNQAVDPITIMAAAISEQADSAQCWTNELTGSDLTILTPEDIDKNLRITEKSAAATMTKDGYKTVVLQVNAETYLRALAEGEFLNSDDSHFDLLHNMAFDFGVPMECDAQIIGIASSTSGVQGDFIVVYSTRIDEFIETDEIDK